MNSPQKLPGCPTCTVTIDGSGALTHEAGCVSEDLRKHKDVLHKIGHLLKEVGITIGETAVEVALPPNFGGSGS